MLRRGVPAQPILNGFCGEWEVPHPDHTPKISTTTTTTTTTTPAPIVSSTTVTTQNVTEATTIKPENEIDEGRIAAPVIHPKGNDTVVVKDNIDESTPSIISSSTMGSNSPSTT